MSGRSTRGCLSGAAWPTSPASTPPTGWGAPRTVHVLNEPARIDAWELARRYREYVPWVDALSGSATFLPMADGALYQVSVSQSGLVARPLNQAGREAVAGWR